MVKIASEVDYDKKFSAGHAVVPFRFGWGPAGISQHLLLTILYFTKHSPCAKVTSVSV